MQRAHTHSMQATQHPCIRRDVSVQMGRRSAKIAGRKGKADAKRSKAFSTIGKKIIQYIKAGGSAEPNSNPMLADLLKQAKDIGCPKDIIERNMKKATDKSTADFTSCTYEAYGPGGASFIIEALTDNVNRSVADVKSAITKASCKVADSGSVMFAFSRAAQIVVTNASEEALFEAAMEFAEDISPNDDDEEPGSSGQSYKVFMSVADFAKAKTTLTEAGFSIAEEETLLVYKPNALIELEDEDLQTCEGLLDRLLILDDVDQVFSNVADL